MYRRAALIAVGVTVIISFTFVSPTALTLVDHSLSADWRHLADVGQAYGAVSAIYSALAVVGVSIGLIYQARAYRLARVQAIRTSHREILARVIDNPRVFGPALGINLLQSDDERLQQHLMTTSWVGYLYSAYDVGVIREADLRSEPLPYLFAAESGRRWWETARQWWVGASDRKDRAFGRIIDEAYEEAVAAGPAAVAPPATEPAPAGANYGYLLLGAAALGAVGWRLARTHRRARPHHASGVRNPTIRGGGTAGAKVASVMVKSG